MNMQALMKQAQALQKDMMNTKDEVDHMTFEGTSSFVTVVVNGKKEVVSIKIDYDESMEKEDFEMLQDILQVAINDAMKKVDATLEQRMGKFSGSMPGIF